MKEDEKKPLDGQAREVGLNVDEQSFNTRARHAALVGVREREREDGDADDEKEQTRHDVAGVFFNALFNAAVHDLTQMTFGYSRDDIASFLPVYLDKKILNVDPFQWP